ncbi:hypothetical protein CPB85DRAFT_1437237 [Mucidula mucida]|nr:hypothetical protein CPB85DRAFT_1437237 [Mucidula mucida]
MAPPLPIAPSDLAQYATNASADELYQEELTYAGLHLGGIAFGLHIMMYFMCTYYLLRAPKVPWFTQTYITILLVLATVNYGTNVKYGGMAWIEFRGFPAGPGIFLGSGFRFPMHLAGDATLILTTIFVDALVIHRAFLVWENNWHIIVVPILMLSTATIFSIIRTVAVAQDIRALAMHSPIADGLLIFWTLSLGLNVLLTALIMGRLLCARARARRFLGVHHATVYTQVAAMIIESAAVYTLITIAFVILFGLHHPAYNVMIVLYPQVQCITSEAIILRVHERRQRPSLQGSYPSTAQQISQQPQEYRLSEMHVSPSKSYSIFSVERVPAGTEVDVK